MGKPYYLGSENLGENLGKPRFHFRSGKPDLTIMEGEVGESEAAPSTNQNLEVSVANKWERKRGGTFFLGEGNSFIFDKKDLFFSSTFFLLCLKRKNLNLITCRHLKGGCKTHISEYYIIYFQ